MSGTDYTYDGEVERTTPSRPIHIVDKQTGTILPLLHLDPDEFRHYSSHLFAAETKQRCALCPSKLLAQLAKPRTELENTATRLSTDFSPEHADLIDNQRKKQRRRERRIKRGIVSVLGWSIIAGMVYLIAVTSRSTVEIWDPWKILGIGRV